MLAGSARDLRSGVSRKSRGNDTSEAGSHDRDSATSHHALLLTYEPQFLTFGLTFFRSIAVILIVWHGLKMMFTQQTVNTSEQMFNFAKLLMFISFGYALIAYYESPIPGIGVSFSNLITDQAANFANILDARSLELTFEHLDELWNRFVQPDTWAILPNLLYWLMLISHRPGESRRACVSSPSA